MISQQSKAAINQLDAPVGTIPWMRSKAFAVAPYALSSLNLWSPLTGMAENAARMNTTESIARTTD